MSNDEEQQSRREECRREVRAYLAKRPVIALDPASIRRGLSNWDFSTDEVRAACALLFGLDQLEESTASLGATKYYKISAKGTLEHERNQ